MKVFVTGASGWIGAATVRELRAAGHEVVGLARSADAAARVEALGATAHRGSIDDVPSVLAGAAGSDAVVHLAYDHDFTAMAAAAQTDRAVVAALGDALAGSDRPLVVASGVLGLATGRAATEEDRPDPAVHPRVANAQLALDLADRGVRSSVVRFAPTVHGAGDHGFVARLVEIARERGSSGYVGDGASRWPAVHRDDAATLVRLVVEGAPAGSVWHAVAEEGVPSRDIATAVGDGLGLPVTSVPAVQAGDHFGWLGLFFAADCPAASSTTRERLGWAPTGPTLLEDLRSGAYTSPQAASR